MKLTSKHGETEFSVELSSNDVGGFLSYIKSFRLPKNEKGKIGIVVAIQTEGIQEKVRLNNDFIAELHRYLKSTSTEKEKFKVIPFPPELAVKIIDAEAAKKYLEKTKAHFIVYGNLSRRKVPNGDDGYVFRLHGAVRHSLISQFVSNKFGQEFRQLLPEKIIISEPDEIIGFEMTERMIRYVIKYIIGMAAFLSGDIVLSERLFLELWNEVSQVKDGSDIPIIDQLLRRLPRNISHVMMVYIDIYYALFAKTRNREWIRACKQPLETLKKFDLDNYKGHIVRSIFQFFFTKPEDAIEELKNLNNSDVVWHYSLGFLYAYQEDIENALIHYQKTFYKPAANNVYNEVEVFVGEIIKSEPAKAQLVFFRGIINYKIRADYSLARDDFKNFLSQTKSAAWPQLRELAEKYLQKMEDHIGLPID